MFNSRLTKSISFQTENVRSQVCRPGARLVSGQDGKRLVSRWQRVGALFHHRSTVITGCVIGNVEIVKHLCKADSRDVVVVSVVSLHRHVVGCYVTESKWQRLTCNPQKQTASRCYNRERQKRFVVGVGFQQLISFQGYESTF